MRPGRMLHRRGPRLQVAPFTEHANLPRKFANVVEGPVKNLRQSRKTPTTRIDEKTAREAGACRKIDPTV
jgi:hypothetical protein